MSMRRSDSIEQDTVTDHGVFGSEVVDDKSTDHRP